MTKETHFTTYEGLEFEVVGYYEEAEEETGTAESWDTDDILLNGVQVYQMLNQETINAINEQVTNEQYNF